MKNATASAVSADEDREPIGPQRDDAADHREREREQGRSERDGGDHAEDLERLGADRRRPCTGLAISASQIQLPLAAIPLPFSSARAHGL